MAAVLYRGHIDLSVLGGYTSEAIIKNIQPADKAYWTSQMSVDFQMALKETYVLALASAGADFLRTALEESIESPELREAVLKNDEALGDEFKRLRETGQSANAIFAGAYTKDPSDDGLFTKIAQQASEQMNSRVEEAMRAAITLAVAKFYPAIQPVEYGLKGPVSSSPSGP